MTLMGKDRETARQKLYMEICDLLDIRFKFAYLSDKSTVTLAGLQAILDRLKEIIAQ